MDWVHAGVFNRLPPNFQWTPGYQPYPPVHKQGDRYYFSKPMAFSNIFKKGKPSSFLTKVLTLQCSLWFYPCIMSNPHAVSCLGCDKPFTAGSSLALHLHWHPECSLAYSAVAVNPSNTYVHLLTTAQQLASAGHPDHGKMPSLLASTSNAHELDGTFNDDGDQDSIVGDGAEDSTVDDDKDLHDVFSFPRAYTTAQKNEVELLK
jgi:hypothetical protein